MTRILDAASVIEELATHTDLVVTHRAAPTLSNGIFVPGATSTTTIPFAVVVPSSGRELQRLPEARRSQETRTIYNTDALLIAAQAGNNSDLVTIDGVDWECQQSSEWDASTGYYSSIVQRPA